MLSVLKKSLYMTRTMRGGMLMLLLNVWRHKQVQVSMHGPIFENIQSTKTLKTG